jgi:nicotinic acetylcholine receptor
VDVEFYEGKEMIDLSDYTGNMEWTITGTAAKRNEMYYPCCSEPYPNLMFNLTISRRNSVFSVMSVTPYVFLAILCPVIFLFPYSETQRFSLGEFSLFLLNKVFFSLLSVQN